MRNRPLTITTIGGFLRQRVIFLERVLKTRNFRRP
jgi:hypothetical protein